MTNGHLKEGRGRGRTGDDDPTCSAPHPSPRGPVRALSIIGCRVDQIDQAGALNVLARFLGEDRPHLAVTADSSMLVRAQRDHELYEILETADLVVPDSIGVVWASRVLGTPLRERVTGVDLVDRLCEHCVHAGLSVFLLGSAPGVAQRASERLAERFPGLIIVGTHHGFFTDADEEPVLAAITSARPHVLFVALGIPRQEKWLHRHLSGLPVRLGMGVGGSLDVVAGEVKRAPAIYRRTNLEWLYRTLKDPRRFRKTLLLPVFVWLTLRYSLAHRRQADR